MALWPKASIDDIEKRFNFDARRRSTRILVIDDDPNSFEPFGPLQNEGYAIDFWRKVNDLSKLEQGYYDIIFLDVRGVGEDWSPDQGGFGILELLKTRNPNQLIVAYSGEAFDFGKRKFYQMADDMIPKASVDPAKCKVVIDNLIRTRLGPAGVWGSIEQLLRQNGLPEKRIQRLEQQIVRALERNQGEDKLKSLIKKVVTNEDVWSSVITLILKLSLAFSAV
jgi:CheY-like chemotaxis protein